jgi:hypothetical protein
MTNEEAKQVFLNRGYVNGIFDGDKWRQSIVVISKWLEQEPVLDKIKGYIDHIRNTGMGKKKSLEFIEKFIEGLKAESENKE